MREEFLKQTKEQQVTLEGGYTELARILNIESLQDEALQAELQSEHSEGTES